MPMAVARQGEFLVIVTCRGELVADRSVQITAPVNVPNLQIVWMAPQGAAVKVGDPVLRFDASGAKRQLQEKEAALAQAQASLDQAIAQAGITAEQDKLELASLRQAVELARIEASKKEIVSAMQGEENRIASDWRSRNSRSSRRPWSSTPLRRNRRSPRRRASWTRRKRRWN